VPDSQAGLAGRIRHVFVLMLENRSFDHLLGASTGTVDEQGEPRPGVGIDPTTGTPTTVDGPTDQTNVHDGDVFAVRTGAPFVMPMDPPHEFCDVLQQLASVEVTGDDQCAYSGRYPPLTLGGFVDNYASRAAAEDNADAMTDPGAVLACLTTEQVPVLSTLAREFAVCDRWFSSMPGPTWPNRFFLHAATSGGLDRSPTAWETVVSQFGGYHFEHGSIFEALDRHRLAWRVYHGDPLPQVAALSVMDLDTMLSHFRGVDDLYHDLQDDRFTPAYVFIEPDYGLLTPPLGDFQCGNSQHPRDDVTRGDALIKLVYEAIRQSPHWESSLLLITYDEHGGFYDHVPPPPGVPPGDVTDPANNRHGFRFDQLGVRVPAVVVSPWVPDLRSAGPESPDCNVVDHTPYDHSSLLATLEHLYGVPPLTARDAQANDLLHLLSAGTPREAPRTLPAPADSGFVCAQDRPSVVVSPAAEPVDLREVPPALQAFVQLAAIQDARLQPDLRARIPHLVRAVTTVQEAREYLVAVATRLRAAGLGGGSPRPTGGDDRSGR
jgi:phospholipase C